MPAHLPVFEEPSDQCGSDGLGARIRDQPHAVGGEIVFLPQRLQHTDVARSLVAEPEVLPHDHSGRAKPVHQDTPNELLSGQRRQLRSERKHAHRVGPVLRQQVRLARLRCEDRGMRQPADHGIGVRVEGHGHHWQAQLTGTLAGAAQDALVAAVHTVEDPYGHHGPAPVVWNIRQSPPAPHVEQLPSNGSRTGQCFPAPRVPPPPNRLAPGHGAQAASNTTIGFR